MPRNAIIMGAAGRDFHNFNVVFRDNPEYRVIAFTAAQIPFIQDRVYPPELSGRLYPKGIPIHGEEKLPDLIREHQISDVFFSYSDISHENVMHLASLVLANGASFHLLGPQDTMLTSNKPVVAVLAVRTGAGKSTISRKAVDIIRKTGLKPVVIRHPMPYGSLKHPVQRFEKPNDLDKFEATIEEREEYEGHMEKGVVVFAGIDYQLVLWEAEKEGDILVWDGGNNDFSFFKPSISIVVADPIRVGHESRYHPGETNVRMADIIVVNKANMADPKDVDLVTRSTRKLNPEAKIVRVRSEALLDRPDMVKGKRALVVEDGPSVTHGELAEGAGAAAARAADALLVDPRPYAVGSIKNTYEKYRNIGPVLPALGYSPSQLKDLEDTIASVDCDVVILGTPADLTRLISIQKPIAKVRFEAFDMDSPGLEEYLKDALSNL